MSETQLQSLYRARAELRAAIIELEASKPLAVAALLAHQQEKNDGERKALVPVLQAEGEAGVITSALTSKRAAIARLEGEIEAAEEARRAKEWEIRRHLAAALQNRGYGSHDRDLHQAVEDAPIFEFGAQEDDLPF